MLKMCLIGAGRIGAIHAGNVAKHAQARLHSVVDVNRDAAVKLAQAHGAEALTSVDQALANKEVNGVLIASSTNTHVDYLIKAAQAGKAIFCEKPIDLDLARADGAIAEIQKAKVPCLIAFNRRFDPSFRKLHDDLRSGAVGKLETVIITSRDPSPPPLEYVKVSGGLFRDMMIHDLDMARWLLGEEPVELYASASCLVDSAIGKAGDVDTAVVTLRTASGVQAVISNSRRATYGYDQRIEVLGSKGMLQAGNVLGTTVSRWNGEGVAADKPLNFFLERYGAAYRAEWDAFVTAVETGKPVSPDAQDGRKALVLADAATQSAKSGKPIAIKY